MSVVLEPMGEVWPACDAHAGIRLMLAVCVDVKAAPPLPETAAAAAGGSAEGSPIQELSAPSASGSSATIPEGHISFHTFPEDAELRRKWIRAIPRDN